MAPQICDQRRSQIRKERKVGFAVCNVHMYTCAGKRVGGGGRGDLIWFLFQCTMPIIESCKAMGIDTVCEEEMKFWVRELLIIMWDCNFYGTV